MKKETLLLIRANDMEISSLRQCKNDLLKFKGMIKLFKKLPYKIEAVLEGGMLVLKCNFEEVL